MLLGHNELIRCALTCFKEPSIHIYIYIYIHTHNLQFMLCHSSIYTTNMFLTDYGVHCGFYLSLTPLHCFGEISTGICVSDYGMHTSHLKSDRQCHLRTVNPRNAHTSVTIVGSAPTGDAPTTSASTSTKVRLILEYKRWSSVKSCLWHSSEAQTHGMHHLQTHFIKVLCVLIQMRLVIDQLTNAKGLIQSLV